MHNFELHPEFYNQPILLTEEEKKDPSIVIKQFFEDVKLVEVRIHLHNLLEVALTRPNSIYDDSSERDAIFSLTSRIEKLIESCSCL